MSDTSQGEGWWQASDAKWYPPDQHPDPTATTSAAEPDATQTTPAAEPDATQTTSAAEPDATQTTPAAEPDATQTTPAAEPDATQATPAAEPDATQATPVAGEPDPTQAAPASSVFGEGPQPEPTAVMGATSAETPPAATPPPAGPPPAAAPPSSGGGGGGRGKIIAGIVAVVALAAAAFGFLALTGDDEAAAGEVVLEAVGDPGPAPFTQPVASVDASVSKWADEGPPANVAAPTSSGPAGYQSVDGDVPGVFGGSLNESACAVPQLVEFLDAEPAKAAAWAEVIEIDAADISAYIDGLTPTNLSADARVLNHGFVDGEVEPREAVLQRGTAVLTDTEGIPRVNCYSGNPLTQPGVDDGEEFAGDEWPAFNVTNIVIINQAPADISEFELIDLDTGELFTRPAGSTGEGDQGEVDEPATGEVTDDGPIEFDTLVEDTLDDGRREARFTIEVPDSAVITITAENERNSVAGIRFILENPDGRRFDENLAPGGDAEGTVVFDHDGGGQYEVLVSGGPAAYSFTIELGSQNDAGSGADAGDELSSALPIEVGPLSGLLGDLDGDDFFEVELESGSEFSMSAVNGRESETGIRVIAEIEGDRIFDENIAPGATEEGTELLSGTDEGTVVISVSGNAAVYDLDIGFTAQEDTGADGDAGDDLGAATAVSNSASISGDVGDRDPADFFTFELGGGSGSFSMTNDAASSAGIRVIVEDSTGSRVVDVNIAPGTTATEDFEVEVPGEHRLQITGNRAAYSGGIN